MMTKSKLTAELDRLTEPGGLIKAARGDNHGPLLGRLFVLQEMESYASAGLKSAWRQAVQEGLIPADETLREEQGERILAESNRFSILCSVSKPRANFNRDDFIDAVAKKFKIDRAKLVALVPGSTHDGNPSLSKKILEAAS